MTASIRFIFGGLREREDEPEGPLGCAALFQAFCKYWSAISIEELGIMKALRGVWMDGWIEERID